MFIYVYIYIYRGEKPTVINTATHGQKIPMGMTSKVLRLAFPDPASSGEESILSPTLNPGFWLLREQMRWYCLPTSREGRERAFNFFNHLVATFFTLWIWSEELSHDGSCHWTASGSERTKTPTHPPGLYLNVTFTEKPSVTSKYESGALPAFLPAFCLDGTDPPFLTCDPTELSPPSGQAWTLDH